MVWCYISELFGRDSRLWQTDIAYRYSQQTMSRTKMQ